MPTGIILANAKAVARAEIDSRFGPIPSGLSVGAQIIINQRRDDLAYIAATQAIYVRDAAIVHPDTLAVVPGDLIAPNGGGPLTGNGVVQLGTGTLS